MLAALKTFSAWITDAHRVLILSHRSPDGDTLGSSLAWDFALKALGKDTYLFDLDKVTAKMSFLPGWESFHQEFPDPAAFDLVIINDHGDIKLSGLDDKNQKLLDHPRLVNIDHHPSNNSFGRLNFIDTNAASCTQIVTGILRSLKLHIDHNIATCLLTGLYTDTGSFQHSNTSPEALAAASFLMSRGADFKAIIKNAFKTLPLSTMKLWGEVLANLHQNAYGITSSTVTEEDLKSAQAEASELEGVVNYLNSIPETKMTLLLSEREGSLKGSLRTPLPEGDVAKLASFFKGGGHVKAAGFSVPGRIQREKEKQEVIL